MGPGKLRLDAAFFNGDHGRLADEVGRIEAAALDFVHLNVFDGHLVPDLGFAPRTIAALRPLTRLPFEVHLAAADPLRLVPQLAEAGCDLVLFHAESAPMLYGTFFAIKEHGLRAGLVLGLAPPLQLLEPVVALLDAVLLLARVTGEGARGATFKPLVVPLVRAATEMARATSAGVDVQAAGGVNRSRVEELSRAGATSLALGAVL